MKWRGIGMGAFLAIASISPRSAGADTAHSCAVSGDTYTVACAISPNDRQQLIDAQRKLYDCARQGLGVGGRTAVRFWAASLLANAPENDEEKLRSSVVSDDREPLTRMRNSFAVPHERSGLCQRQPMLLPNRAIAIGCDGHDNHVAIDAAWTYEYSGSDCATTTVKAVPAGRPNAWTIIPQEPRIAATCNVTFEAAGPAKGVAEPVTLHAQLSACPARRLAVHARISREPDAGLEIEIEPGQSVKVEGMPACAGLRPGKVCWQVDGARLEVRRNGAPAGHHRGVASIGSATVALELELAPPAAAPCGCANGACCTAQQKRPETR